MSIPINGVFFRSLKTVRWKMNVKKGCLMEGINSKRLVIWGFTPFGSFFQKRRFENQNLTKTKKQAFYFRLLLIYCTPDNSILELFLPKPNRHLRFKGTPL
jgi:hypothetical protein